MLLYAGQIARVGQGYCRESSCTSCSNTFDNSIASCVDSLGACETQCASFYGCKGMAFSANPRSTLGESSDAGIICADVGKARCVEHARCMLHAMQAVALLCGSFRLIWGTRGLPTLAHRCVTYAHGNPGKRVGGVRSTSDIGAGYTCYRFESTGGKQN